MDRRRKQGKIYGNRYTPNAELTKVKILLNSVISIKNGNLMIIDFKYFCLNKALKRYEYMWVSSDIIPTKIIHEYNLEPLFYNDKILTEIRRSTYELPQAGYVTYEGLLQYLKKGKYHPTKFTTGLFRHATKP